MIGDEQPAVNGAGGTGMAAIQGAGRPDHPGGSVTRPYRMRPKRRQPDQPQSRSQVSGLPSGSARHISPSENR